MKRLKNQLEFEALIIPRIIKADAESEPTKKYDPYVCVQFSAAWCGPCKRIDKAALVEKYGNTVTWYICDVDENDYTLGYCGMRKIPSFAFIVGGQFAGRLEGCSSTADVGRWMDQFIGSEK